MKKALTILFLLSSIPFYANAQKFVNYNLARLLTKNQLIVDTSNHAQLLDDSLYSNAISIKKIAWLKNVSFEEGVIEVDLRGKNILLQSFLGIAFHAVDSNHYELVYFRPFNFQHTDTTKRKWSLQYMVIPDYPWNKLRHEHPFIYESSITLPPKGDEWFHASIVVNSDSIKVYVNHSKRHSLAVKKLGNMQGKMIGLWNDGLSGDFANLMIKQKNNE